MGVPVAVRRVAFLVSAVLVLVASVYVQRRFLVHLETIAPVRHDDPLHPFFAARDYSVAITALVYGSILLFLILHAHDVGRVSWAFATCALLVSLRTLTIWALPLGEPPGAVMLRDPVLNSVVYAGDYCARDLFFSGHVATAVLIVLCSARRWQRGLFAAVSAVIAVLLVLQKVHYTVDVLAAPGFAWIAWSSVNVLRKRMAAGGNVGA